MDRSTTRHLAGAATAWSVYCLEGLLAYLGVLGYMFAVNGATGGPLAAPFMLLVSAVLGGALTVAVLIPAVAVTGAVPRLRWAAAYAVAVALLGLLAVVVGAVTTVTSGVAAIGWLVAAVLTAPPLIVWRGVAALGLLFRHRTA